MLSQRAGETVDWGVPLRKAWSAVEDAAGG